MGITFNVYGNLPDRAIFPSTSFRASSPPPRRESIERGLNNASALGIHRRHLQHILADKIIRRYPFGGRPAGLRDHRRAASG
jgi:hypothetical protein